MKTAKAWGLTPRAWREQSTDDQALMLAFELFEGTRESYREEFREAYHKKNPPGGNGGNADREFRAMQKRKQIDG